MGRYTETREMRLRQVERCLDSGMQIRQWCKLNKVAESTFYVWLKVYREESCGRERSNGGWIELTRQEARDSKALAAKGEDRPAAGHDGADRHGSACPDPDSAIRVSLNGAGILIPSGCDDATIRSVLSSVASL